MTGSSLDIHQLFDRSVNIIAGHDPEVESLRGRGSAVWAGAAAAGCWSGAAPPATVVVVRGVPWWGVILSAAAPVLMVGGWTVAAGLQPHSFDPVTQTVSALAAPGAADRWVMTLTFLVVGACDFATGVALRPARAPGRLILMAGAVAGLLVAANPEQPGTSFPLPHMIWAAAGCTALVSWPAGAWRRGPSVPWGLRPAVSAGAVVVLLALLAWFGAELIAGAGGRPGRAHLRRGAGAVAPGGGRVLPSCRRPGQPGCNNRHIPERLEVQRRWPPQRARFRRAHGSAGARGHRQFGHADGGQRGRDA